MGLKRWQDWGNAILGLWTVVFPWLLAFAVSTTEAARAAWILGAAIVVLAAIAVYMSRAWEEGLNILLGLCLLVCPWALSYPDEIEEDAWRALSSVSSRSGTAGRSPTARGVPVSIRFLSSIRCRQAIWHDQAFVPLPSISQGFTTGTAAAMKGAVSRVATVNPRIAAIAAICPSAMEMARPDARARLTRAAYTVAAC